MAPSQEAPPTSTSHTKDGSLPTIRATLFDMDGLLIDSEDKYTLCTNLVLHEYGRPSLPWHIKSKLQGRPGPQAGKIFHEWAQLPISREEFYKKAQGYQREHFPETKPLSGVEELLWTLRRKTGLEMALGTSSQQLNFELKTRHLEEGLFAVFPLENRVLGDDPRIGEGRGKPAPYIWLVALETINERLRREGKQEIRPEECLVFEDSVPGVESGRRAGMQVVWCPHPELLEEYKGREEEVLAGLTGEYEETNEKNDSIGVMTGDGQQRVKGAPGKVGDGWARLVHSLDNFPYEAYGIKVKDDTRL